MSQLSIYDLLSAGVHFGHSKRHRQPDMDKFIFCVRNNVSIINLEKTLPLFKEAVSFISEVISKNGKVLFVGTKDSAKKLLKEFAIKCNMPYVNERWLGGMMTNYKTIRNSIKRLKSLDNKIESEAFGNMTKKEILDLTRLRDKLEKNLGGFKNMYGLPDAIFVIDVLKEKIAIQEANKLKIPVVAIVDTNAKTDLIDYVIPGNDDAHRAIKLYLSVVSDAILNEQEKRKASFPQPQKENSKLAKKTEGKRVFIKKRESDLRKVGADKNKSAPVVSNKKDIQKVAVKSATVASKKVDNKEIVAKKEETKGENKKENVSKKELTNAKKAPSKTKVASKTASAKAETKTKKVATKAKATKEKKTTVVKKK